jgi:four helix bundle protein
MAYNDFTEMPVWQLARELAGDVYKLTEKLPRGEDFALKGQLRKAAISIAANIAEGFGRGHAKDKKHFYLFSRGSTFEVRSHLYCGETVGYFVELEILPICNKCKKVTEELNKIIKTIDNSMKSPSQAGSSNVQTLAQSQSQSQS